MKRVWTYLSDEEAAEVVKAAEERWLKPSALVRMAVLAFIQQPAATVPASGGREEAVIARLEALVATLGQHVAAVGKAVPAIEDAWAEHEAVRGSLRDIAIAVGTLAGSIEPPANDRT